MSVLFPRPFGSPPDFETDDAPRPSTQRPLSTLLASARRLTGGDKRRAVRPHAEGWQGDAWDMYDLVGEQRFLANTLAGRMAQARFFVGSISDDPLGDPVPLDPEEPGHEDEQVILDVFDTLGGGAAARSQIVLRLGINLFVAGDGYLVGIPRDALPPHLRPTQDADDTPYQPPLPEAEFSPYLTLDDLDWHCMSVSEVTTESSGEYVLHFGADKNEQATIDPDRLVLIRVWRPHPNRAWQADSPTRSSLGVLRELVGLTMHIGAQVDSRLAGAGLLIVPQTASDALKASRSTPDAAVEDEDEDDPFTDALIEAMTTPISDRANASAVVPLVVTVPDDVTEKFHHISFSTPLDSEARDLRDESIRRLALGQDAPPELLLGTAGMNHWGAWLVREEVVTTHIEPPLALICDALTTQFLWPTLIELGYTEDEARGYVIWYDVSHMIVRPNRATDAQALYDRGVISDEALRESMGFSDDDAPLASSDPAVGMALDLVKNAPSLMQAPGLDVVVAQIRAVLADPTVAADDAETAPGDTETPTGGESAPEDGSVPAQGQGAAPDGNVAAPALAGAGR